MRNAIALGLGGLISFLGVFRDEPVSNLELENGFNLLLEDGDFIELE